jgi:hypothetical protein
MKQLHNAQDAIRLVFGNGYLPTHFKSSFNYGHESWVDEKGLHFSIQDVEEPGSPMSFNDALLDPLFWQALGRARGLTGVMVGNDLIGYQNTWRGYATVWFETRLSNGDETKFWESLP